MSEFTLVIGNKNYSSWSLRAWLWMRHLQLDFEERLVRLYQQETPLHLEGLFSDTRVPVLIHRDLEVWDSLAILEYVSALFPEKALPAGVEAHAVMRSLCAEMHSGFPNLRNELPMNCRRERRSIELSDACKAEVKRIEALWQYAQNYSDHHGHWLFGSFSMADAMFAPVVFRLDRYGVEVDAGSRAYIERMLAHPAMLEWVEASRAEPWVIEEEERA